MLITLTTSEIICQIINVIIEEGPVSHIVFMGMGEPLDNYKNVMEAIRRLNDPELLNIGARKITVSTSGLISKFDEFSISHIDREKNKEADKLARQATGFLEWQGEG